MSRQDQRNPPPDVRWAMDALVVSGNLLFGYGWCACSGLPPDVVALEIEYSNGKRERIAASCGLDRGDVKTAFPDLPGNCGFLVYAAVKPQRIRAATLSIGVLGGLETARLSLSAMIPGAEGQGGNPSSLLRIWYRLAHKVWVHLRQGNFAFLMEHSIRLFPKLVPGLRRHGDLAHLIEKIPAGAALIIDHDLGGGANIFRDRLIDKLCATGQTVALLTFVLPLLSYHLRIMQPSVKPVDVRVDADWWLTLAAARKFSTVYFNNCVSHPNPERMPEVLLHFQRAAGARLILFIHDFHVICPSHFLLDRHGDYCGIPAVENCRNCLPAIDDTLAALYTARDIDTWRASWLTCLEAADEVVCFATSGRDLMLRAYPALAAREIAIRPHEVQPLANHYVYPEAGALLTICVVGMINLHKGSKVVLALAEEIERRNLPARICIIGTLNAPRRSKVIEQTGHYRPEELPDLIARNGVHLSLMPSIWPETFSFVTHELISAGVPIISFDLGAHADAVRTYRLGQVIPMRSTEQLLDDILAFKIKLDGIFREQKSQRHVVSALPV